MAAENVGETTASDQRIPLPPPSNNPHISAVHPSRPWPWTPPKSSPASSDVAAKELELLQAHYYIRHGERTPVRTRLTHSNPPIPPRWDYCRSGRDFRAAVLAVPIGGGQLGIRQEVNLRRDTEAVDANGKRLATLRGECMIGQLTDVGRQSTLTMGRHLRDIYVRRLGLLPDRLHPEKDAGKLYVRSTNMTRTIESAQQILTGLLDMGEQSKGFVPTILVRNSNVESLLPNTYSCPTLYKLDSQFSRAVATLLNPSLAIHDAALSPHLSGVPLRVDGHPRLSGVLDTIRAAQAHGIPVPREFQKPEIVQHLEQVVCEEWFSGYRAEDLAQRAQYRRLAMGPLLYDLADRLSSAAALGRSEDLRLGIYATHDTTLAGIMSTLDAFDRRWPAFTASIGVELWRRPSEVTALSTTNTLPSRLARLTSLGSSTLASSERSSQPISNSHLYDGHYVRLLYNGRLLLLPACDKQELCSLKTFLGLVAGLQKGNETQKLTWEQECALGRGERSSK